MQARARRLAGPLSGRGAAGDVGRRDAGEPARTALRWWWSCSGRPGRSRGGANAQGRAEIRHRPAQHRHRGMRRERHQASHLAPARQHLLRRARLRADAGAGAQARNRQRPCHRRADQGGRLRATAVRPAPHAGRQLSARRRHPRAQRCDHRHHWPGRDRARDCAPRRGLRHARALSSAHAARPRPRSAN